MSPLGGVWGGAPKRFRTKGAAVLAIIYTIIIFGIIIFIHEFGHFLVCRLTGVKVNEFAMGMGPKILKYQGKRTLYSLRLFPIGGFCSMEGEDSSESVVLGAADGSADSGASPSADDDVSAESVVRTEAIPEPPPESIPSDSRRRKEEPFYKKSILKRVLICGAGAVMNLLLGFLLILCITAPQEKFVSTKIAGFHENAPAGISQLQVDDEILKVNGTTIFIANDIPMVLQLSKTGVADITVRRNGEQITLNDVDFSVKTETGEAAIALGFYVYPVEPTFFGAVAESAKQTVSTARNSWLSIQGLFTGKIGFSELSGPVGVGKYVGEAAKYGFSSLVSIAAFISISIGMFNLLPFPALDGGRILFLLIEAVRRKPINPKWEAYINTAGLLLLFGLMIVVTLKDIWGLF